MTKKTTLKITYAAVCLALAMVLPLLTGQLRTFGKALAPMHIAVFLCGFLCGWPYGALVGFISPLLRFAIFGMPVIFPSGLGMAFELASYGFISGLLYKVLPKKICYIYVAQITAMVGGRIVWGIVRLLFAGLQGTDFPFSMFIAGAVTDSLPGIALHIVLIPIIIIALRKARLVPNG